MGRIQEGTEEGRSGGLYSLFEKARLHVEAGGNAARLWPFEIILISVLVEQAKSLMEFRSKVEDREK